MKVMCNNKHCQDFKSIIEVEDWQARIVILYSC